MFVRRVQFDAVAHGPGAGPANQRDVVIIDHVKAVGQERLKCLAMRNGVADLLDSERGQQRRLAAQTMHFEFRVRG